MEYVRIGTEYYKFCNVPILSGDTVKSLERWSKGEIITDKGKDYLQDIKKYDGFVTIPSHQNYKQEISSFYNKYQKIDHELVKGRFDKTEEFLRHIFGEQYQLGIDYLTILWQLPLQILPILCLVSSSRNTGKTSFLNWLKLLFQGNMTINKNEDFRSKFNSDWGAKLIISVDEVLLDKKEDSERIKNLSTAGSYKIESKGKDKIETDFFGKFILCSNNEESFIKIDENEIRYWVIKVKSFEVEDVDMIKKLNAEVPQFLYYLNNRKIITERKTRMWFTKRQIYTPALDKVIKGNKTCLSQEIKEVVIEDFVTLDVDVLRYTATDLLDRLSISLRTTRFKIAKSLKDDFKLQSVNGSYQKYFLTLNSFQKSIVDFDFKKGRYYEFLKSDYIEKPLNVEKED